jgi:RNA polymerase sigma factor (TIGR02999 family)
MSASPSEITRLIAEYAGGDKRVVDRLFKLVYDDLRLIAHRQLRREAEGHTLNTTALVHEAYLGLVDQTRSGWRDRAHFFAVASTAMRHILIDYARWRRAEKRGGATIRVPLRDDLVEDGGGADVDLLALDEALTALSERDARMGRTVECRFFGGMTVEETSEALGTSVRTVERNWTRAKAYLYRALVENETA